MVEWKSRKWEESIFHTTWICNCKITVANHFDGTLICWYIQDGENNMDLVADNNVIQRADISDDDLIEMGKKEAIVGLRSYLGRKLRRMRGETVFEINRTTAVNGRPAEQITPASFLGSVKAPRYGKSA